MIQTPLDACSPQDCFQEERSGCHGVEDTFGRLLWFEKAFHRHQPCLAKCSSGVAPVGSALLVTEQRAHHMYVVSRGERMGNVWSHIWCQHVLAYTLSF